MTKTVLELRAEIGDLFIEQEMAKGRLQQLSQLIASKMNEIRTATITEAKETEKSKEGLKKVKG